MTKHVQPWTTPPWTEHAACRDAAQNPDMFDVFFFPDKGQSADTAKWLCSRCPVKAECLELSLELGEVNGVWGGLSGHERKPLLRERRKQRAAQAAGEAA